MTEAAAQEGHPARERVERYARLRSAFRALAPSLCFTETHGLDEAFTQIRAWLRDASPDAGRTAPASLLARIDLALDVLSAELLRHLRGLRLPQLRATLPLHRDAHPDEVLALLDELVAGCGDEPESVPLLDYLITLLATEAPDGCKRMARDPVELSPTLAARCAAAEAPETVALARAFDEARGELARGESLPPIVSRMRRLKRDRPDALFVPAVLRALVAYNLAVANRLDDLVDTERDLDDVAVRAIEPRTPAREPTSLAAAEPGPAKEVRASAFDSEGLRAIVHATRARLAGTAAAPGAAGVIAARLDTEKLAKLEREALRDPDAERQGPELPFAVVLGLVGHRLPELRDRLADLGIDPDVARSRWVPELSTQLSVAMQALVASGAYDDARRLADARNRFLSAWGKGARMPKRDAQPPTTFERTTAAAPRDLRAAPARRRRIPAQAVLYAAALSIAVALGGFRVWSRAPDGVETYSSERLATISPHLATGYRDGLGDGHTFIGTLREDFARLSRSRQDEAGLEIARALEALGVREVFLFDAQRRLKLHREGGRRTFPLASR